MSRRQIVVGSVQIQMSQQQQQQHSNKIIRGGAISWSYGGGIGWKYFCMVGISCWCIIELLRSYPLMTTDDIKNMVYGGEGNSDLPKCLYPSVDTAAAYVNNETQVVIGWVRPPKIFAHIHLAKTAGTELNGYMASKFERVCGHKGYTYDYYQYNDRVNRTGRTEVNHWSGGKDSLSTGDPNSGQGYNRGRIAPKFMTEIGFEDCDWISHEADKRFWVKNFKDKKRWPLEFHVPCREPFELLMSQCNYMERQFDCSSTNLKMEITKCLPGRGQIRYSPILHTLGDVKCFDPIPVEKYVDYMGNILQPRRLEVPHVHRSSNQRRNRDVECIWKDENTHVAKQVMDILMKDPYYSFCMNCTGTTNDLFAPNF